MTLWMAGICLCACGGNEAVREEENTSGILQMGCFYEDHVIALSAPERFMYSEWEPAGFEYICTDPTCSHSTEPCSARRFREKSLTGESFCVVYHDRLIIVDSYAEHVDHGSHVADGVTNLDVSYVWYTDVYEADLDGANRKCKLSFAGSIGSATLTFAAVLEEGVLYFGGPIESRVIMEYDEAGVVSRYEIVHSDAFYAVDLADYSMRSFAETEGRDSMSYSYNVDIFDGYVYARADDMMQGCGTWYRIKMETGEWEEIASFDSKVPWFYGAIGDTVYYGYNEPVLYALDVGTKEKREFLRVEKDLAFLVATVFEDQIWALTDYSMEEGNYMTEYTVLNAEGEAVDFYHYDEYILFYGVVGDRLIYSKKLFPEEMWWADWSDIANLAERGVYIGHAEGRYNDFLSYGVD